MQITKLGVAEIDTKEVIAGSYVSIKYQLRILHPIDDTGYIKIVFRTVTDFGFPQFEDPSVENYWTAFTTGDCRLDLRWDKKGNKRPWSGALYIKVMDGYLDEGDIVTIIFGDQSKGSQGWQMQTFCEDTFEFKTLIDHIATFQFIEIEKSPELKIIPGEPKKAVCIAPSQIEENTEFNYFLKLEDCWGNPVNKLEKLIHKGFSGKGSIHRISVTDEKTGLSAVSNPIKVVNLSENRLKYFWGDFHGQSEESVGTNTIDDYWLFARDYAILDICGHQANDFQVTDEFWEKINSSAEKYYKPGEFLTFPGYEWSGNTPLGGDRNVYFLNNKGIISRSSEALLPDMKTKYLTSPTATKLFEDLANQQVESFVFAHVGGRFANIDMHDEDIEVAIEIHSAWGTFEWLLQDAFDRGYRIGICANSDGHKGRPGASYPGRSTFGSLGGLTCVLAEKLNREDIANAMKQRHSYGTTGNRILIDLELILPNGEKVMMGDIIKNSPNELDLEVIIEGTAPIEKVDIFNGQQLIETLHPYSKDELGKRIKIFWSGAEKRGRARLVRWDGSLKILDNSINNIIPINFWNPDNLPILSSDNEISWRSITTGGGSGMILSLDNPENGSISLETDQINITCNIDSLGILPQLWEVGGIQKQLEIVRLSEERNNYDFSFKTPIILENKGDNPIFIRVTQEDGHMAWTSPVYLISNR